MRCVKCGGQMKHVFSFSAGNSYEYYRCPDCWFKTKRIPYAFPSQASNPTKLRLSAPHRVQSKRVINNSVNYSRG